MAAYFLDLLDRHPSTYKESCIDNLTNGQAPSGAIGAYGKNQDFAGDSACKSEAKAFGAGRKELTIKRLDVFEHPEI